MFTDRLRSIIYFENRYRIGDHIEDFYFDTEDDTREVYEIDRLKNVPNFLLPLEIWYGKTDNVPYEFEDEEKVSIVKYSNYTGILSQLFSDVSHFTRTEAFTLVFEIVYGLYVAKRDYSYSQQGNIIKEGIVYTIDENPRVYEFEGKCITVTGKYHPYIMDTPNRKYNSDEKDYEKDLIMICRQALLRINERIDYSDRDITDIFMGKGRRVPPIAEVCIQELMNL